MFKSMEEIVLNSMLKSKYFQHKSTPLKILHVQGQEGPKPSFIKKTEGVLYIWGPFHNQYLSVEIKEFDQYKEISEQEFEKFKQIYEKGNIKAVYNYFYKTNS